MSNEVSHHEEPATCLDKDGCPLEGARLRREWHQLTAALTAERDAHAKTKEERNHAVKQLTDALDAYEQRTIGLEDSLSATLSGLP